MNEQEKQIFVAVESGDLSKLQELINAHKIDDYDFTNDQ
jgi:hypothetical protein